MALRHLALLTLVSCGGGAPALPPLLPPVFEGVTLSRVECTKNNMLMPVEIDGTLGWFIIDSGAFTNVVYESFAKRARLTLEDNQDRLGGGHGVRVKRVAARSFFVPGLSPMAVPPLVMLDSTSPLAREGCEIAGVISPATLATEDSALLVDFGAGRLARVMTTAIDEHLARITGPRFAATIRGGEYTPGIDVAFGAQNMRLMIDTGSCCTWVTTSSTVGKTHLPTSTPGVEVRRLQSKRLSRRSKTPLMFGDVGRELEIRLLEPDPGDAQEDGAIGGDALQGCIVAISQHEMRGACRHSSSSPLYRSR
jgi:hypothetical protein